MYNNRFNDNGDQQRPSSRPRFQRTANSSSSRPRFQRSEQSAAFSSTDKRTGEREMKQGNRRSFNRPFDGKADFNGVQ